MSYLLIKFGFQNICRADKGTDKLYIHIEFGVHYIQIKLYFIIPTNLQKVNIKINWKVFQSGNSHKYTPQTIPRCTKMVQNWRTTCLFLKPLKDKHTIHNRQHPNRHIFRYCLWLRYPAILTIKTHRHPVKMKEITMKIHRICYKLKQSVCRVTILWKWRIWQNCKKIEWK